MSLSFTGFKEWDLGIGNRNHDWNDETDMDMATKPGWDQFGRIDCGSLVFSRARLRADGFDWDLER
jgi:hypothetical protein